MKAQALGVTSHRKIKLNEKMKPDLVSMATGSSNNGLNRQNKLFPSANLTFRLNNDVDRAWETFSIMHKTRNLINQFIQSRRRLCRYVRHERMCFAGPEKILGLKIEFTELLVNKVRELLWRAYQQDSNRRKNGWRELSIPGGRRVGIWICDLCIINKRHDVKAGIAHTTWCNQHFYWYCSCGGNCVT